MMNKMRLTLDIVGSDLNSIKEAIKEIINNDMDSNCLGWAGSCEYQYTFTRTDDIHQCIDDLECINPNERKDDE